MNRADGFQPSSDVATALRPRTGGGDRLPTSRPRHRPARGGTVRHVDVPPDPSKGSVPKVLGWVLLGIGTLAAMVAAWFLLPAVSLTRPGGKVMTGGIGPTPPIEVLHFDDGSTVEILAIEKGSWELGNVSPTGSIWGGSTGSSGTSWASAFSLTDYEQDGELCGLSFKLPGEPLLLGVRLLDAYDAAVAPQRRISGGEMTNADGWDGKSFPGVAEMTDPGADPNEFPELVVEMSDGTGGWIRGDGPAIIDTDPEVRGAIRFLGWSRKAAKLSFRAIRPGVPPVEFDLPNPRPASKPPAWHPKPLPQTFAQVEWDLELQAVRETHLPSRGRLLIPKLELRSKASGGLPDKPAYALVTTHLNGAHGSSTQAASPYRDSTSEPGHFIAADEDSFELIAEVVRTGAYPHARSEALIVGSGTVAADGESVTGIHLNGAYHLKAWTMHRETKGFDGPHWKVHLEGYWPDEDSRLKDERLLTDYQSIKAVFFVDGAPLSRGEVERLGGGMRAAGVDTHWDQEIRWHAAPPAGAKIELGLVPEPRLEQAVFFFDSSSIR